MYRRMTHWATLGLIRLLAGISDIQLEAAAQAHRGSPDVFDGKPDPRLANCLNGLAERYDEHPTALEAMMAYHPTAAKDKLSNLLSQCQQESPVLYTQNTVVNFHHLLVATLIAYGSVLARIFDADGGLERSQLGTTFSVRTCPVALYNPQFEINGQALAPPESRRLAEAAHFYRNQSISGFCDEQSLRVRPDRRPWKKR